MDLLCGPTLKSLVLCVFCPQRGRCAGHKVCGGPWSHERVGVGSEGVLFASVTLYLVGLSLTPLPSNPRANSANLFCRFVVFLLNIHRYHGFPSDSKNTSTKGKVQVGPVWVDCGQWQVFLIKIDSPLCSADLLGLLG